ncbi:MAG: hypothetical protein K0S51_1946 [Bacillales bacterium]|jgi:hypothetical protein|nr:hypothetical protein [Bacillales bacterium]
MKIKIILLWVVLLGMVTGMVLQTLSLIKDNNVYPALFITIGMISFIILITLQIKKAYSELKQGIPFDDERSRKVKLLSSSRAYFYSLYIWIILLAFQKYIEKDDILLIGLLGMGFSLLISWLITRNKKGLE